MKQHTPNSISIEQLKKDAKKLKKEKNIKLSKAQDITSETKTNFNNWKQLHKASYKYEDTINLFSLKEINGSYNKFSIYKKRPLLSIVTQPGYASAHIIEKLIGSSNNKNIFYIDCEENKGIKDFFIKNNNIVKYAYYSDFGIKYEKINKKNEENFELFFNHIVGEIKKNDILIINEIQRISYLNNFDYFFKLLLKKCEQLNITVLLVSYMYKEVIDYIEKYSSAMIFISTFFYEKYNNDILSYCDNPKKFSEVYHDGLRNYKYYNFVSKEKINISIKR